MPASNPKWKSLRPIVEVTGGEVVRQDRGGYRLRELLERLRTRYLLGYYAPKTTGRQFREITVKVTDRARIGRPELTIRARKGYYSRP